MSDERQLADRFNLGASIWNATIEDRDEHAEYVHKWTAVTNPAFIAFENQYKVNPDGLIPDEGPLYTTNKAEAERVEKFWRRNVRQIAVSNGNGAPARMIEVTDDVADRIKLKAFHHMELSVVGVTTATARKPVKSAEVIAGDWLEADTDRSLRIPVEYLGFEVFITVRESNYYDREKWKELTALNRKRNTFRYDAQSQYDFARKFVVAAEGFTTADSGDPVLSDIIDLIPWPILRAAVSMAFSTYEGALKN